MKINKIQMWALFQAFTVTLACIYAFIMHLKGILNIKYPRDFRIHYNFLIIMFS